MLADTIVFAWDCPDCAKIKGSIPQEVTFSDDFRTKSGNQFNVIHTYSNNSTRYILDKLGMIDSYSPAMITATGAIIDDPKEIISYLEEECVIK